MTLDSHLIKNTLIKIESEFLSSRIYSYALRFNVKKKKKRTADVE